MSFIDKTVNGVELHPEDQQYVLRAYVNRFTGDHKPKWADEPRSNGEPYRVQFRDDQDWLQHSLFYVRVDGRLDQRYKHCASSPTWPEGVV